MLCAKCGAPLMQRARFCTQCGGVVSAPQILGKRHHRSFALLVIAALLTLIAVAVALIPLRETPSSFIYSTKQDALLLAARGDDAQLLMKSDAACERFYFSENEAHLALCMENGALFLQKKLEEPVLVAENARFVALKNDGSLFYTTGAELYRFDGQAALLTDDVDEVFAKDESYLTYRAGDDLYRIALKPGAVPECIATDCTPVLAAGNEVYYLTRSTRSVWLSDLVLDTLAASDAAMHAPETTDEAEWAAFEAAQARIELRKALRAEKAELESLTLHRWKNGKSSVLMENLAKVRVLDGKIFCTATAYQQPGLYLEQAKSVEAVRRECSDPHTAKWTVLEAGAQRTLLAPGTLGELTAAFTVGETQYLLCGSTLFADEKPLADGVAFAKKREETVIFVTKKLDIMSLWTVQDGAAVCRMEDIERLQGAEMSAYITADGKLYHVSAAGLTEIADGDLTIAAVLPDGRALAMDDVAHLYLLDGAKIEKIARRVRSAAVAGDAEPWNIT